MRSDFEFGSTQEKEDSFDVVELLVSSNRGGWHMTNGCTVHNLHAEHVRDQRDRYLESIGLSPDDYQPHHGIAGI